MRRSRADDGFTLMEVVVAMMVFTIFCAMSLGLLVRTGSVTRGNLQRTAAANLATEQIQSARSMTATEIPAGTTTRTQTVKNTVYTITQTAKFLAADSSSSVCDGTSTALAYKLISVTVTWPDMGSIKPVRQDTLKAVGVGTDGLGDTGALAISVSAATGVAAPNVTITLSNGTTGGTDDNGCAVFTGLTVGTYNAVISLLGFVGIGNTQQVTSSSIGISAGVLTRTTMSYDSARSFILAAGSPVTGAVIPAGLPVLLSSSILSTPTQYAACPASGTPTSACATAPTTAANGSAQSLYPGIYTVKLGTCTETLASSVSADLTQASSIGSTVTVPMGAITVNLKLANGTAFAGTKTITVKHISGCTETYTVSGVSGVKILVPYGSWNVSVPSNSSGTTTATTTVPIALVPVTRTGTADLVVTS